MVKTASTILLLILLLVGGYWWSQHQTSQIDPALKSVVSNYSLGPDGLIEDPTGALGIKGKDDVFFTKKKNVLEINYGKQEFSIEIDSYGEEIAGYLKKLGISIHSDQDGRIVVKFKGEAVTQFE
ncbi:hypothetical protein [Cohnella boryungensis]|uniref:Uncharacterized protein n=1 Tax=Cohnella boryungensis TaxID=768479 RepID=A0ABV8S7A6_9BACL